MTDQRVGRHIRIYEWDEVDIEDDTSTLATDAAVQSAKAPQNEKKASAEPSKGLSALLKKKLF